MRMYDIIRKKRDGGQLTEREIAFFVKGYTKGDIPDYQASALAMAIFFNGMTEEETVCLTKEMADSGDKVDLSRFGELSADKHSTGGVGDKTTLIVAPLVAAMGLKVAKMSGRGLGHTGGTVDKLEAIPGYKTELSSEEFFSITEKCGLCVIGQSGNLTPADKKLYALRDVTATVDSIPLITSSIMSKKLAAGSKTIVLDVKVGSGAFMKSVADAEKLAAQMVKIGNSCGRNTAAVLTNMDIPLGRAVGNSLEVIEAVELLKGNGEEDLKQVCLTLAANMVSLGLKINYEKAFELAKNTLESGKAFEKMKEWITLQGGDVSYIEDTNCFKKAAFTYEVKAESDGCISSMNAEEIGMAAVMLGAGRATKNDTIDHTAGIVLCKKTGDAVIEGDTIAILYTNREERLVEAKKRYLSAVEIGQKSYDKPLIYKVIK